MDPIVAPTLKLGIALLSGGNATVQQVHYYITLHIEPQTSAFFCRAWNRAFMMMKPKIVTMWGINIIVVCS